MKQAVSLAVVTVASSPAGRRSSTFPVLFAVLLLPMFVFATPILKLTGQTTEVAERTGKVALWLIPIHFSFVFQFTLQRFLQCQLKSAVIVWVSGAAFIVDVFVSWLFVYRLRVGIVETAILLDFSWWLTLLSIRFVENVVSHGLASLLKHLLGFGNF